jgi:hypothetical protein
VQFSSISALHLATPYFFHHDKGKSKWRNKEKIENLKADTVEGKLANTRIKWYKYILRMNKERT